MGGGGWYGVWGGGVGERGVPLSKSLSPRDAN